MVERTNDYGTGKLCELAAPFLKTSIRNICEKCYLEEERAFDVVSKFLKKRKTEPRPCFKSLKKPEWMKN